MKIRKVTPFIIPCRGYIKIGQQFSIDLNCEVVYLTTSHFNFCLDSTQLKLQTVQITNSILNLRLTNTSAIHKKMDIDGHLRTFTTNFVLYTLLLLARLVRKPIRRISSNSSTLIDNYSVADGGKNKYTYFFKKVIMSLNFNKVFFLVL